jgi:hypothetical protein
MLFSRKAERPIWPDKKIRSPRITAENEATKGVGCNIRKRNAQTLRG